MGITEDPDPAMATTAETPPFTTVDTDIPTTVDTDIPITVDTDTIVLRTGVGKRLNPRIVRQERQAGHWIKPPMREADRFQRCQLCGGYIDVFDLAWSGSRRPAAAPRARSSAVVHGQSARHRSARELERRNVPRSSRRRMGTLRR